MLQSGNFVKYKLRNRKENGNLYGRGASRQHVCWYHDDSNAQDHGRQERASRMAMGVYHWYDHYVLFVRFVSLS